MDKNKAYFGVLDIRKLYRRSWSVARCSRGILLVLACLIGNSVAAQTEVNQQETTTPDLFRLERVQVDGGAELVTIHAKLDSIGGESHEPEWVPLVSVLRDTLGDSKLENDRLRYLWELTYTRPTFWQRVSGAVPFMYTHIGSKQHADKVPPPLMDLSAADRDVWNKICWRALQTILIDPVGTPIRASSRSYQQNITDLRRSHIIRALSLLTLYQELGHEPIFTAAEQKEIQARLLLTDKTFGGLVDELKLPGFYQKQASRVEDNVGHNWELLRQQAEANGLYFEPLEMPDGRATHALLWVAKSDLAKRPVERFDPRFLSISDPWSDKRLLNWDGYSDKRYFDREHRRIESAGPETAEVELIPLALYGLDNPKIPALLVDFRDKRNPKRREMSRRVLQDVTRNVLAVSQFGDIPYLLGRSVFDFVTGRRGMDINQPSRLKTYAQLKLLLSLDDSLEPELRSEISDRVETVSLNPMENSIQAERKLARQQYKALLAYATRPDGLPAKLARDRRAEMTPLEHGKLAQIFFRLANVVSFGKYSHREPDGLDIVGRLDLARQRSYHTKFLREVARTGSENSAKVELAPKIEVVWNLDQVKSSLRFLAEYGSRQDGKAVVAAANIFARTNDDETRRACLAALSQINNGKARSELLRISEQKDVDDDLRSLSVQYLANRRGTDAVTNSNTGTGSPDR
ncbi:MAG TPA: hypothetical protein VN643_14415 [Pyrinomonadaceae bacterium]|nr:hypothetical protein [Pyrinomonadaceae bacterium]